MFVCAYCQACLHMDSSMSVEDLKRELNHWCTYKNRNYHKTCVKHHAKRTCSECGEYQFHTRSGWTCPNGHGGAPSNEEKFHVS